MRVGFAHGVAVRSRRRPVPDDTTSNGTTSNGTTPEQEYVVAQTAVENSGHRNGWWVVSVSGEIDVHSGPSLREHLLQALANGERDLVVDLAGVSFLDSSGLGVLVTAHKRARAAGGALRLASCQPAVATIFQITALDRAFSIHPTLDDAISAPRPEAPADTDPGGTA
jgi:anti-sigma B factor antagonist